MAATPNPVVGSSSPESVEPSAVRTELSTPGDQTAATIPPAQGETSRLREVLEPAVGTMIDQYRLDAKLGEGGMGAVWKALHVKLDKHVALKVLPAHFTRDPRLVARFEREMKAVGKVDNPHVVRAMDAGEFQGLHYLVMEYIDGTDLSEFVKSRGPQPVRQACELIRQAALGLAAAHKLGLVHRDIKPSNLFLTKPRDGNPGSAVKILDLGLALLADDTMAAEPGKGLTGTGTMMGTPDYMAPEQWGDTHSVDGRADLYALGCTLFFLLTGRPPYGDEAHNHIWKKMSGHATEPIPDVRAARGQGSGVGSQGKTQAPVPDAVVAVYQRLMAKNPDERIQTADELAHTLLTIVKNLGSSGSTPSVVADAASAGSPSGKPPTLAASATGSAASPTPAAKRDVTLPDRSSEKPRAARRPKNDEGYDTELDLALRSMAPAPPPTVGRKSAPADARRSSRRNGVPMSAWIGIGGFAAVLLLAGIIVKIKNRDGSTTEIKVPEGATVEISGDNSHPTTAKTTDTGTPVTVKLDLTPPKPLGTWEMGPEPPWFKEGGPAATPYSLKDSPVLPGIVERPRILPGVRRWNVDTLWPRGIVSVVRWSPDGQWIAAGSADGHVRLYDARTLELRRLLPGGALGYGVQDLSWHPESDRLAIVTDNGWSNRILSLDGRVLWEEATSCWAIAWDHKGQRLATGGVHPNPENKLVLIQIRDADGKLLSQMLGDGENPMGWIRSGSLVWSPDDRFLCARHGEGKLRLWNVQTGKPEVLDEVSGEPIHGVAWSDQDWLAVTTGTEVRLYGPDRKLARKIDYAGARLAWDATGKKLFCGAPAGTSIRDRDSGAEVGRVEGYAVAWSPDSTTCLTATLAGNADGIRALQLLKPDLKTISRESPTSYYPVWALAWSPDGQHLATGGLYFVPARLWSSEGTQRRYWDGSTAGWLAWRPDGKVLLGGPSLAGRPEAMVWSAAIDGDLTPRKFFESDKLTWSSAGFYVAWSADGQFAAIGIPGGVVQIVDRLGRPIASMPTGGMNPLIAWNHALNRLVVTDSGRPLQFCDPANGWRLKSVGDKPVNGFNGVWSPDGKLFSVPGDGFFGSEGKQVADRSRPHSLTWRPDGKYYATYDSFGAAGVFLCDREGRWGTVRFDNAGFGGACDWHPRGHLIARGTAQSMITAWREADLQPHWHAVLLPDGKAATFSAAGELLDGKPEEVDQYLVYYVEREAGKIETLTPAEFRKLLPADAGRPEAAKGAQSSEPRPRDHSLPRRTIERLTNGRQRRGGSQERYKHPCLILDLEFASCYGGMEPATAPRRAG